MFSTEESEFASYFLNIPWGAFFSGQNIIWSTWLIVIVSAVSFLVVLMAVASEGALIAAGTTWFKGKKLLDPGEVWHKGVRHFGRLLILNIIKKSLLVLVLFLVNVATFQNPTSTVGQNISAVIITTVGIFLALVISSIGIYAAGFIVETELPILESIRRGAKLFAEHVLVSLELSLLLLAIQVGVIVLLAYTSVWVLFPFASFTIIAGLVGQTGLIFTGFLASAIIFLIIAGIVGGILNAFTVSAWMYLFMKMHHEGVGSRILNLFQLKKA